MIEWATSEKMQLRVELPPRPVSVKATSYRIWRIDRSQKGLGCGVRGSGGPEYRLFAGGDASAPRNQQARMDEILIYWQPRDMGAVEENGRVRPEMASLSFYDRWDSIGK